MMNTTAVPRGVARGLGLARSSSPLNAREFGARPNDRKLFLLGDFVLFLCTMTGGEKRWGGRRASCLKFSVRKSKKLFFFATGIALGEF